MKTLYTLTISFICLTLFGQKQQNIVLQWNNNPLLFSDNIQYDVPNFQTDYFYFDSSSRQVFFHFDFPVNDFVTQNDLEVSNIVYETITKEELGSLDVERSEEHTSELQSR